MDVNEILRHVDHTVLGPAALKQEFIEACEDGVKYGAASVCIPPAYVEEAYETVRKKIAVCTVIGFPNGYSELAAKFFEAELALKRGADELDMVINIGKLKDGRYGYVKNEITKIKRLCGKKILKVIIECCLLTDEEKVTACRLAGEAGADYVKTSTGFSTGGATFADVELLHRYASPGMKVKASGGIATLEDAQRFLDLGADRLGTSRIIKLIKKGEAEGY